MQNKHQVEIILKMKMILHFIKQNNIHYPSNIKEEKNEYMIN